MMKTSQKTTLLCYSALMCALIIVSTLFFKFSLPGTDILITTQVFFILLCGHILPIRYCFYTIGAYILIGLLGVPVFSAVCGPAVLATPSFGYLLGFPFGAAAIAFSRKRLSRLKYGDYLTSFIGLIVIYLIALPYIAVLKGAFLAAPVPFGTLMTAYCFAFLPLDILKAVLAALVGGRLRKILRLA